MAIIKKDIWFQGKATSVRVEANVWKAFEAKCEALTLSKGQGAEEAQRNHNGTLAEAITKWVGEVALHDACSLWLGNIIDAMRGDFEAAGYPLPKNITAKIALPAKGWRGKALGDYWGPHMHQGFDPETHNADKALHTIFVHPCESDPAKIIGILVHELCHAADNLRNDRTRTNGQAYAPVKQSHGKAFQSIGLAMGLTGEAKSMIFPTQANGLSCELPEWAQAALDQAGKMPHNPLNWAMKKEAKQTTRMLKFEHENCPESPAALEGDGSMNTIWRMSASAVGERQQVVCPCCGEKIANPYAQGDGLTEDDRVPEDEDESREQDRAFFNGLPGMPVSEDEPRCRACGKADGKPMLGDRGGKHIHHACYYREQNEDGERAR